MMIVLTKQDLLKMSSDLREELIRLMFEKDENKDEVFTEEPFDFEEHQQFLEDIPPHFPPIEEPIDVNKTTYIPTIQTPIAEINIIKNFFISHPIYWSRVFD